MASQNLHLTMASQNFTPPPSYSYSVTMDTIFNSLAQVVMLTEQSRQQLGCPASNHVNEMFTLIENMKSKVRAYELQDPYSADQQPRVRAPTLRPYVPYMWQATEATPQIQAPTLRPYEPFMWQIENDIVALEKLREKKEGIDISRVPYMEDVDVKRAWLKNSIWVPRWSKLPGTVSLNGMYEVVSSPPASYENSPHRAVSTQAVASYS
jgi:hypothetical protein